MDTGGKLTWHVPGICIYYAQYGTICARSCNVTFLSKNVTFLYLPTHITHSHDSTFFISPLSFSPSLPTGSWTLSSTPNLSCSFPAEAAISFHTVVHSSSRSCQWSRWACIYFGFSPHFRLEVIHINPQWSDVVFRAGGRVMMSRSVFNIHPHLSSPTGNCTAHTSCHHPCRPQHSHTHTKNNLVFYYLLHLS